MTTRAAVDETARAVLLAHSRFGIEGCRCGWAELGRCHTAHQVDMLRKAGVLIDTLGG